MSLERLRNVMTGEIRDVETTSDEYMDLINEVYDHDGSARPKWEVQGHHAVRRVDEDDIQEEDLGYKFKPIPGAEVDTSEVGPEPHPERALSQGEVDSGVESHEAKMSSLGLLSEEDKRARVEPLERVEEENRAEQGRELAGTTSGKRRRSRASSSAASSSSKASGSSSGGGSTSSGSSSSGGSST